MGAFIVLIAKTVSNETGSDLAQVTAALRSAGAVASRAGPTVALPLVPPPNEVRHLMRTLYVGYSDSHLTEELRRVHGLAVSRESARR